MNVIRWLAVKIDKACYELGHIPLEVGSEGDRYDTVSRPIAPDLILKIPACTAQWLLCNPSQ